MGVQLWAPPIPGPVQGPGQRTRLSPPVGGPGGMHQNVSRANRLIITLAAASSSSGSTEAPTAKKTRLRCSKVWDFFTLNAPNKVVICRLCKFTLAYHSSTTAMHEHLKRKHPGALVQDGRKPPQVLLIFPLPRPGMFVYQAVAVVYQR